ncbi:DUF5343 domain-containing protein [Aminobacter niigataensis]|uniref:DUF5343 domain-containing protein n=1 Tax=Aminobacter niigataensis TaxID=83265 RepID=UPI0024CD5B72|nr:DUF5343 domain-containing protein [Aminobacter niigataensis]CAI2934298.1 conserved protein of unknown function [Aminobacter niigataensis]
MASHPYISGSGNITQMIGYLKKNFPATVTSETIKKYGLASNNESYVINALQFIGLIDEEGKRQENAHDVLTTHDEEEFQSKFAGLIKTSYSELFEMYGDEAWTLPKAKLIGYFRQSDKTSDVIGARQAAVFQAFRSIAGYEVSAEPKGAAAAGGKKPKAAAAKVPKAKIEAAPLDVADPAHPSAKVPPKPDMALTVRIEINLPAEGTQDT